MKGLTTIPLPFKGMTWVVWIGFVFGLGGCLPGPQFFKQKDEGNRVGATLIAPTKEENGVVKADLKAGAAATQVVEASQDSNLSGSKVSLPPDSLAVDTSLTVREGNTVATDNTLEELKVKKNKVNGAGTPMEVSSSAKQDLKQPGSLQVPLPEDQQLTLQANAYPNLVVVYEVEIASTGKYLRGLIPRTYLTIVKGQYVTFEFEFFGTFQAALLSEPVREELKSEVENPISFDEAPVAADLAGSSFEEDTKHTVTLGYSDKDGDSATACEIHTLKKLKKVNACACSDGKCEVTVRGKRDANGSASFLYTVTANDKTSNEAKASFDIEPVNDAPTVAATSATVTEDSSTVDLTLDFTDPDGARDVTGCSVSTLSSGGTLGSCSCSDGACSVPFTPASDYFGSLSFDYSVTDGSLESDLATFTINVEAVNDPPTVTAISDQTVNRSGTVTNLGFTVDEGGTSLEDGQSITVTATTDNQTLLPDENITVNYTSDGSSDASTGSLDLYPTVETSGTATITVTVEDDGSPSKSVVEEFVITVLDLYGSGSEGDVTVSASIFQDDTGGTLPRPIDHRRVTAISQAGTRDYELTVNEAFTDGSAFAAGDEIMWHVPIAGTDTANGACPDDRGKYGFVNVLEADGGNSKLRVDRTIPVAANGNDTVFTDDFCVVQIVRVPHYNNLTIDSGASLVGRKFTYSAGTGGLLPLRVAGTLTLNGTITVSGKGFGGGSAVGSGNGLQGHSPVSKGTSSNANNAAGGGGGNYTSYGAGGGANYGAGGNGNMPSSTDAAGGTAITACSGNKCKPHERLFMGAGGGGADDTGSIATGGRGGGMLFLAVSSIQGTGNLEAKGYGGGTSNHNGGGGGAGGTIFVRTTDPGTDGYALYAKGGGGGGDNVATNGGGGGGGGIIRLEHCDDTASNSSLTELHGGGPAGPNANAGSAGLFEQLALAGACP